MKDRLLTGWHLMRWIRLGFGVYVGVGFIETQEPIAGIIAAFLLYQVVFNTGCGVNSCEAPTPKNDKNAIENVSFEEVRVK